MGLQETAVRESTCKNAHCAPSQRCGMGIPVMRTDPDGFTPRSNLS
jgi:hypothetical protein